MVEFTASSLQKLAELLRTPEPEILQGDELPASSAIEIISNRDKPPVNEAKTTPKTIEEFEEQEAKIAEESGFTGAGLNDRKVPEYTMNYQQAVTAEDVFLQIGHKTPSSASCENLIVRVKMPEDKRENVELTVDRKCVTISSSQHYLKLPLPHDIDPDKSKASWDSSTHTLVLTLMLEREFDFINF